MPRRSQVLPPFMSRQVARARRFYLGPPDDHDAPVAVVCGGWERTAPGYRIDRSDFQYAAVEFVAGGRGTLRVGGREYPLSRGTVFSYGPGIPHEITTDATDRLSKYFVDFAGRRIAAALGEAGIPPGACLVAADPAEVQATFERIIEAGKRGTHTASRIAALHAQILLLVLSDVRLPRGTRDSRSRQTFLRCRDYIEKNHASLRTAEDVASACDVAPAYLSRLFSRFAGQPAYRFLMRLKMNEAAALLRRNATNVADTADAFGMDPFHFSRVFKRVHGRAPSTFLAATAPRKNPSPRT